MNEPCRVARASLPTACTRENAKTRDDEIAQVHVAGRDPRPTPFTTFAVVALLVAFVACDNRACLAQSELFAGYRPELIDECCLCLARRGTAFPEAACGEAALTLDGGVVIVDDGGPSNPPIDGLFGGDDLDDVVQESIDGGPGEIPCLCSDNANTCAAALNAGRDLLVTGACLSQGTGLFVRAPCEDECRDVLTFTPPTVD